MNSDSKPEPKVVHRPPPAGAQAGVDEAMIRMLVDAFYERVRADETLGPIFEREISDWRPHLDKMYDFWSSVVLMTKRYDGRPVPAHIKIEGLDHPHFEHWLALFQQTARDVVRPPPPTCSSTAPTASRNRCACRSISIAACCRL